MKRFATILGVLSILVLATSVFAQPQYGWTISASSTDPAMNSATATNTVATHYLWFNCGVGDGMAAAAMTLTAAGPTLLASTAVNGYLNAAVTPDLLLAVGGCPTGPVVAVEILVIDLAGTIGLSPHAIEGKVTVDCNPVPTAWPFGWIGLDTAGGGSPSKGDPNCEPVSVEATSWGNLKALYR